MPVLVAQTKQLNNPGSYIRSMSRILAIDYGKVRCGLAVTDPLQIIATALTTVPTKELLPYLNQYISKEKVTKLVVGEPFRMDGSHSDIESDIKEFILSFRSSHPTIPVFRHNEMYTSKMALRSLIDSGIKKKKRRDKSLLDSTSATIILQEFLQHNT